MATRTSLLRRLREGDDGVSWEEFCDAYGRVLHAVAAKSGLSSADAEDVVQETLLTVVRKIRDFDYDREKGRFKSWLLTITRNRVIDRLRQRRREQRFEAGGREGEDGPEGAALEELADEAQPTMDEVFELEWKRGLYEAARERIRGRVAARQFQIFDLSVTREWSVEKVVEALGVTANQVYLARHRVGEAISVEVRRMEQGEVPGGRRGGG